MTIYGETISRLANARNALRHRGIEDVTILIELKPDDFEQFRSEIEQTFTVAGPPFDWSEVKFNGGIVREAKK